MMGRGDCEIVTYPTWLFYALALIVGLGFAAESSAVLLDKEKVLQDFLKSDAAKACEISIERTAKYDYKWVEGEYDKWYGPEVVIDELGPFYIFHGENIRYQNLFGVWIRAEYACMVNVGLEYMVVHRVDILPPNAKSGW